MSAQGLKKERGREREKSLGLLGCGCLVREHIINIIKNWFTIWYEMKYLKKQIWFL